MGFDLDLSGETAIVTGGGRGIGEAIAEVFGAAGANIVVVARTQSEIHETTAAIRDEGGTAAAVQADVTRSDDVTRILDESVEQFDDPTILVNNAGVNIHPADLVNDRDEIETMLGVNVQGLYDLSQQFARRFRDADAERGRIINISSIHGKQGVANRIVYSATKAAVLGMTRSLAAAWARAGITVNSVSPGNIEAGEGGIASRPDFDLEEIPINRPGEPADVAYACLFLATPYADYITGEDLAVDGGISITTGPYENIHT